jgi:uncharacterized membrane protein
MSSILTWFGGDPNVLINYLLGLVIIILYAQDKFNTPTYDRDSMGPFSQLPPQLLTIDVRYRQGLRIYIFLLLALYTALCIIGPSTLNNQSFQIGTTTNTNQLWPVASATFLISTGAAKDSSVLGKIEHFIRQYSHKAAYIPSIVSNLAYAIRNVETAPWLQENKDKLRTELFLERKSALTALIGEVLVDKLNDNPSQQGLLAAWARANIVFYCMQQMFRGVLPSERLSRVTELPENIGIFDRLKKEQDELRRRTIAVEESRARKPEPGSEAILDQLLSDIQRFSKEASLTVVVLLSQAVRTFSDLNERLAQLGFRAIELRDHSDHLVYLVMVNFSIASGAFLSYALLSAVDRLTASDAWLGHLFHRPTGLHGVFNTESHVSELLIVITGALIYMIVFKVMDYLREGYLDVSEWRENLEGYVPAVVITSVCSAFICILLMVLLLSPLGLLPYIWTDPTGLGQQFMFQLVVAGLGAGFAVSYLRQAVKVHWRERWSLMLVDNLFVFRGLPDSIKLIHALLAASLVGLLTAVSITHTKNTMIDASKSSLDVAWQSFDQNQGWLSQRVPNIKTPADLPVAARVPAENAKEKPASSNPGLEGTLRLPRADMVRISCSLLDLDAAMHAFNAEDRNFLYTSDLVDAVNKERPNSGSDVVSPPDCPKRPTKNESIEDQTKRVKDICSTLNKVGLFKASPASTVNSGPQSGGASSPPPRLIVPTLFRAPEMCELNFLSTQDPDEQNFLSLGNSISGLFVSLDNLNKFAQGENSRAVVAFPMLTAFFIAYAFGAGCRLWRAWWLNNEGGQQEFRKLKEQIFNIYGRGFAPGEFEHWLASPLTVLNNVAPKEAVRYEGLKTRLYAKIENKQIDFEALGASSAHGEAYRHRGSRMFRRRFARIFKKTRWGIPLRGGDAA